MTKRAGGTRGRFVGIAVAAALVAGLAIPAVAPANNLDRNTAQRVAKFAAKKECRQTTGCEAYKALPVRLQTHHRANGKILVQSHKNGIRYLCRQQIVIKLDHFTGDIRYFLSRRKCQNLGPQ